MIEVAFDYLENADARAYFNEVPTSFDLDDETVDRLLPAARSLLRESPDFQRLVRGLNGTLADEEPAP